MARDPLPWLPIPGELMPRSGLAANIDEHAGGQGGPSSQAGQADRDASDENHPQEHRGLDDQQPRREIESTRICGRTIGRRWAIPRISSEPQAISA